MSETFDAPQAETPAPEPVAPEDDLRAAIGAAWDEVAGKSDDADEPEARAPERDERGRFVGANADAGSDAAEPEDKPDEQPQAETVKAPEETRPALPPEVERLQQTLKRHEPLYAARGIGPDAAVDALFNAQRMLETRPEEAIQVLARQYGVDLAKFAPQAPQQPAQAQTNDPAVQAALDRLARLESQLTAQQQQAQQFQQQQEQAVTAQTQRMIDEFAADPKHAHFQTVEPLMAVLISSGQAKGLNEAYEMAVRAHPEVSKAIAQAEREAAEKAKLSERVKGAAQAKAKAVSVRGSPPINGTPRAPEDLRGLIEAAWDGRLN